MTAALALALAALTAGCGDGGDEAPEGEGLSSVEIRGEVGTKPGVEFGGRLAADDITSEVVAEGDGTEVAAGDQVLAHLWIGNGYSQEQSFTTYAEKRPELLSVDEQTLSEVFLQAVRGRTVGSRVAVLAPAKEAFGPEGNPQLGIGNRDAVLVVVDLLSRVLDAPQGQERQAPGWAPEVVEKDGTPTELDFTGTPEPNGELRSVALVAGDGARVESGQTIVVNYLGQVYDAKKPFDTNYASGQPTSFSIGTGGVIKGWDRTLVGARVGSRVLMAVPPDLGYGEEGQPSVGIKGGDTLYFLVDVLGAG